MNGVWKLIPGIVVTALVLAGLFGCTPPQHQHGSLSPEKTIVPSFDSEGVAVLGTIPSGTPYRGSVLLQEVPAGIYQIGILVRRTGARWPKEDFFRGATLRCTLHRKGSGPAIPLRVNLSKAYGADSLLMALNELDEFFLSDWTRRDEEPPCGRDPFPQAYSASDSIFKVKEPGSYRITTTLSKTVDVPDGIVMLLSMKSYPAWWAAP